MGRASAVQGNWGRVRNYEAQDLWELYKANRQLLLQSILFNNSQFPFKVVAVSGNSYVHLTVPGSGGIIDSAYAKLIAAAKEEVQSKYGRGTANTNIDPSKKAASNLSLFKKEMYKNMKELSARVGPAFSLNTVVQNKDLIKAKASDGSAAAALAGFLLGSNLANRSVSSEYVNYLTKDRNIEIILKMLMSEGRSPLIAANLGSALEGLIVAILNDVAGQAKQIAAQTIINKIKKVGAEKEETRFVPLKNILKGSQQSVESKKITITPDIQFFYQSAPNREAKKIKVSIKLAGDPASVKYKSAEGRSGEIWTEIAQWSKVLKTFAVWTSFHPELAYLQEYFGVMLASLAIGGIKENRALMLLTMSNGKITLKSLDVVLTEMKNGNRMIMDRIRARNESAYIHNARTIASGRTSNGQSVLSGKEELEEEIYGKYSKLRNVNLNFVLRSRRI